MRRDRVSPFWAGLVMLVVVCLGTYLAFTKGRLPFVDGGYEVKAVFASAASELQQNAPVRIAGVNVGKVKRVEHGPGGTVVATLEIEEAGRPIRADAAMKIRPRLFLEGNFFVDVEPGSGSAAELPDGGTVPLGQTAIPVQMDEVLRVFDADTRVQLRTLLAEYASGLRGGGARALGRAVDASRGALLGTAATMEDLRGLQDGDLAAFVASQARVSEALADRRDELARLVGGMRITLDALADHRDDLSSTVRRSVVTLRSAHPALADLNAALPPLRAFARDVRPALAEAPPTLDAAQPFLAEAERLLAPAALPRLVAELRPAVAELRGLEPRLSRLLELVEPVSSCVRDNVLPVLNSELDDGHLSSGQPVWQELLRFPIGLAGASQNFDGNGNAIRYHAGGGENLIATRLPSGGELFSLAPEPVLGARPRYVPGQVPPFRPDVPCATQEPADLTASTAPPPASRRVSPPRAAEVRARAARGREGR